MKKHLLSITYDFNHIPNGYQYKYPKYIFRGLVTGLELNGKVYIDERILFEKAFNIRFPEESCTINII